MVGGLVESSLRLNTLLGYLSVILMGYNYYFFMDKTKQNVFRS